MLTGSRTIDEDIRLVFQFLKCISFWNEHRKEKSASMQRRVLLQQLKSTRVHFPCLPLVCVQFDCKDIAPRDLQHSLRPPLRAKTTTLLPPLPINQLFDTDQHKILNLLHSSSLESPPNSPLPSKLLYCRTAHRLHPSDSRELNNHHIHHPSFLHFKETD